MKLSSVISLFAVTVSCAATTPNVAGLNPCASRCYLQAVMLANCTISDTTCHGKAVEGGMFYPEYTDCLLDSCADKTPKNPPQDLRARACAQATTSTESAPAPPSHAPLAALQLSNTETIGTLTQPASIISTSLVGITSTATSAAASATQAAASTSDAASSADEAGSGGFWSNISMLLFCASIVLINVELNWGNFRALQFY